MVISWIVAGAAFGLLVSWLLRLNVAVTKLREEQRERHIAEVKKQAELGDAVYGGGLLFGPIEYIGERGVVAGSYWFPWGSIDHIRKVNTQNATASPADDKEMVK